MAPSVLPDVHRSQSTAEVATTGTRLPGGVRPSGSFPSVADPGDRPHVTLDEDQFAKLYPALQRFANGVADSDLDPRDLVQEALTSFLRATRSTPIQDPEAYLRRAIVNLVASHRRTSARRADAQMSVNRAYQDDYPSDSDSIIERLTPVDRALVVLTAVEGHSIREAASVVGISAVAARARLMRCKRSLRDSQDDFRRPK